MNLRARVRVVVVLLGLPAVLAVSAQTASPPPPALVGAIPIGALYTESVRTSHYVVTRDGTRLAMDLHRPAVGGRAVETRHPVIWQHTVARRMAPDQLSSAAVRQMPTLTQHGYVVALVDRRGAGASFGSRRGYNDRTEARDAYDVTEWLATQPWSTGQVGIYGCSNTGDAAMHAATLMPPHLKAVFAGCFSFSKYDGFLRGGILANWGSGVERSVEEDLRNPPVDGDESLTLLRQAVDQHRANGPLAAMWRSMPFRDSWTDFTASRFWLEGSAGTYRDALARSGAAFYVYGGFGDDFRREGLVAFANLAGNPRKLTLGPWGHCANEGYDLLDDARRFFDHFLKGIDTGLMREPAVRFHVQGAPESQAWRSSAIWPPAESVHQPWQLTMAAGEPAEHRLAAPGAAGAGRSALAVRPALACGAGRSPFAQACPQGAQGLRFTAPALSADTELVGHPLLRLWLSSNLPEPHIFVYLEDLAPDGSIKVLTDGRLKASLRKTAQAPHDALGLPWHRSLEDDHAPLRADDVVELQIALLPLSQRVPAGHRLRLVVTGADPRERVPPPAGQVITLHSAPDRPSTLALPVLAAAPASPTR